MKNYFSAILLGSLFSCSIMPIGIVDEPDTLIDTSSEPDVISVDYESYDKARAHYLVHLKWTDYAGKEWSQRGRLAKLKGNFHEQDRRRLMDLVSFDKKQIFYFLSQHEPDLVSQPVKRVRRTRASGFCPLMPRAGENDEPAQKEPVARPLFVGRALVFDDAPSGDVSLAKIRENIDTKLGKAVIAPLDDSSNDEKEEDGDGESTEDNEPTQELDI
jgi:hypothetical protein